MTTDTIEPINTEVSENSPYFQYQKILELCKNNPVLTPELLQGIDLEWAIWSSEYKKPFLTNTSISWDQKNIIMKELSFNSREYEDIFLWFLCYSFASPLSQTEIQKAFYSRRNRDIRSIDTANKRYELLKRYWLEWYLYKINTLFAPQNNEKAEMIVKVTEGISKLILSESVKDLIEVWTIADNWLVGYLQHRAWILAMAQSMLSSGKLTKTDKIPKNLTDALADMDRRLSGIENPDYDDIWDAAIKTGINKTSTWNRQRQ
jgi:hypothetical protein